MLFKNTKLSTSMFHLDLRSARIHPHTGIAVCVKNYLRAMMLFLNGARRQRGDGKIAVDAAVEGLEAKIRGQAWRETQIHVAVYGAEIGIFARVLAKGNLDRTIHSTRRPGTGNVVHFDVAIDIAHKETPADVPHQNAPLIHSLDFDVHVAGNAELKIHLDDVALELAAATSIFAIAAERPVHIELQGACLLGDVEGDFLASLFELFLGFRADRLLDRELRLVGICAHDFDGAPDVVNFEGPVLDARHRKRLLDGLLLLHWQVAIGVIDSHWEYGRRMKLHGKRCSDFYCRLRDSYANGLGGQGKGKQTADCQHREKASVSHGLLLNSVCFWPTRRVAAPWDSDSGLVVEPGAAAQHRDPSIRAKDRSGLPAPGAIAAAGENPKFLCEPGAAAHGD